MQDLQDGTMREIDPRFLEGIEKLESTAAPFLQRIGELNEKIQQAKDATIPERERQGPIFAIGEIIDIRGGKFRVHAISGKRIYLDSIPSKDAK